MKKLLVTATATLFCLGAFAQGKILFANDGNHLVYYDPSVGGTLGGHTVFSGNMPAGVTLVADLYMGTASTALTLYSTTSFGAIPGAWNQAQVQATSPFIGGGTSAFVEIQVRESSATPSPTFNSTLSRPTGGSASQFWGTSALFNFTLGGSVTYPPAYGGNGNWPAGTFNLDNVDGNPVGSRGAIAVTAVPEPATLALCGLGAAALVIFRRRK